jgi:UDP-N-acetyl-D-mannosaminuronate dehydrogenase
LHHSANSNLRLTMKTVAVVGLAYVGLPSAVESGKKFRNTATLEAVANLYLTPVTAGVHRVSSIRVARAAKVIENTRRDLKIALMNEPAIIALTCSIS